MPQLQGLETIINSLPLIIGFLTFMCALGFAVGLIFNKFYNSSSLVAVNFEDINLLTQEVEKLKSQMQTSTFSEDLNEMDYWFDEPSSPEEKKGLEFKQKVVRVVQGNSTSRKRKRRRKRKKLIEREVVQ